MSTTNLAASVVVKGEEREVIKVALVGFGTVGRSVARILLTRFAGQFSVTQICNRNHEAKKVDWVPGEVEWTDSLNDVIESDAEVVFELMGGIDPAEQLVTRALRARKSVVTANKQLIARCGPELVRLAREHGVNLLYGASVAGGIPVLDGIQHGLSGDRIRKIEGILNGTCNLILSQMQATGASFEDALKEAQAKGFAEADPTEDVDGLDARAKLTILARAAFESDVLPTQLFANSIRTIEGVDFDYANDLGCTIRQISRAQLEGDHLYAGVQPTLVSKTSPLGLSVGGQNLVVTTGEFGGNTVFAGAGAGGDPTAVAVVSDLLWIARHQRRAEAAASNEAKKLKVSGDFKSAHYLRFKVQDRPGIIATLAQSLATHGINIDAVFQRPGYPKLALPFVITLEPCSAQVLKAAMDEIKQLDFHVCEPLDLPILG